MEIGIMCVWDFWGIAYDCFGLWGREKGWDLLVSVQERSRLTEMENERLSCQQIHVSQSVIVTFNTIVVPCFSLSYYPLI